jgi:TetR/AcrR family transcriptional repressor of lmrAB and yxaGH operons
MLRSAARLVRRHGYAATGWRQVVAEGDAPWGSQAHFFPGGKEQLAAEALAAAGERYRRQIVAGLEHAHPADMLLGWVTLAAHELEASGWADGCPIATVALETAHLSDTLAEVCNRALTGWIDALAGAMRTRGVKPKEAKALATTVLAGVEGALLLARTARDAAPLRTVGRELAALLRERVA